MTKGPYRRVCGTLRLNGHSPVLETADLQLIRLDTPDDLSAYSDQQIVVEGRFRTPTTLDVNWVGTVAR